MTTHNRSLRLERPQLLTDLVIKQIRDAIVQGDFKLGELVSEAQIAQRLGTSKTPVREALVRLKTEGLVEVHPQQGTEVFTLSDAQVGQLCRFRTMIECTALREAVVSQRPRLLKELDLLLAQFVEAENAGDLSALARIDMEFHYQFIACCENVYLQSAYERIRYQLLALRYRSPIGQCVENHQALFDAIASGNIEDACNQLEEHVGNTEQRYCDACRVA